jgi:prepilin peptidase CpaA
MVILTFERSQYNMELKHIVLSLLLAIAIIDDIRSYRIHNSVVVSGIAAGLTLNLIQSGFSGLLMSFIAAIIPIAVLLPLFVLRMLGSGDIKLFCAIGAIMGIQFIFNTILFAFLAGGIISLGIMLARKNTPERVRHMTTYIKSIYLSHSLLPYINFSNKNEGGKFHFSPAIAVGCLIQIIILLK